MNDKNKIVSLKNSIIKNTKQNTNEEKKANSYNTDTNLILISENADVKKSFISANQSKLC